MSETSLVSVYITTRNRPDMLDRALASLTKQTFRNFEVLICNDNSEAKYLSYYTNVIEKYNNSFNGLVYIVNENTMGACYSRNILIHQAKGEFVTGLDDDDYFFPERLELFISFGELNKYSFICANVTIASTERIKTREGGMVISLDEMKNFNAVGNQIFVKKHIIESVGGFDTDMPAWQDYDTWLRIINKHGAAYKLNACTMYLDTDTSRNRISTTSKAYNGYETFIRKHAGILSEHNLLSLKYMDLINRKVEFSIFCKELIGEFSLQKRLLKYRMPYYYPRLYYFYKKYIK